MDDLRRLVLATATMSDYELRQTRQHVLNTSGPANAKKLVVDLIDVFLHTGEDPTRRAQAAATCLRAISEAERLSGMSGGYRSTSRGSGSQSGGGVLGVIVILAIAAAIWYFYH